MLALSCPTLQAFSGGLVLDPVYTGDWGAERKRVHGKDLPVFTPEQKALLLENQARAGWRCRLSRWPRWALHGPSNRAQELQVPL